MSIRCAALVLLLVPGCALARPQRIVSLNPCLDAILVRVAAPAQIAALSAYSSDPRASSLPAAVAARFPATRGTAEDVISRRADLVLGTRYEPASLRAGLARDQVPLMTLNVANTVNDSFAQIRAIAARTGNPARGEVLIGEITDALQATRADPARPRVRTLVYRSEGLVLGAGTLTAALMTHTGFDNISRSYGIEAWGQLPLERLVRQPPQLLLRASAAAEGPNQGNRRALHPVLTRARIPIRDFPSQTLNCGGPSMIPALNALARIRHSL